jgi:hypothetical protein
VVDDELCRRQGVDLRRVSPELGDGLTHRGEVDDARHAREVLHDDASRRELDLLVRLRSGVPRRQRGDVGLGDVGPVLVAEKVLQQDLEAVRELRLSVHRIEAEDLVGGAIDGQCRLGSEAVDTHECSSGDEGGTRDPMYLDVKISR